MRPFSWNGTRWKIAARTHAPHRNTYLLLRWTTWQKTTGSLPRPRRNTNSGEKFNNINISMCVKMCICLFILLQTYFQFRQLPCSAARQLCQMQRICLAATLVQGCHNEAKAFFWSSLLIVFTYIEDYSTAISAMTGFHPRSDMRLCGVCATKW
jgi:hypothetical protein